MQARFLPVPATIFSLHVAEAAKTGHESLKYFDVLGIFGALVSVFSYACCCPSIVSLERAGVSLVLHPQFWGPVAMGAVCIKEAPLLNLPIPVDVCIPHPALPLGTCSGYIPFSLTLLSCLRLFGICSDDIFKMQ